MVNDSNAERVPHLIDPKPRITQAVMLEYEQLQANLELLNERHKRATAGLLKLLRDPEVVIEDGPMEIIIEMSESRRPKWKEIFVEEHGKRAAQDVIDNTEPTKSYKPVVRVKATI